MREWDGCLEGCPTQPTKMQGLSCVLWGKAEEMSFKEQPLRGQMNVSSYHFSHLSVFSPNCPHLQFRPTLETPHTNLKHSCLSQHFKRPLKSHQFTLRHKCTSGTPQSFSLPIKRFTALPDTQCWPRYKVLVHERVLAFQLTINFLGLLRMYNKNNHLYHESRHEKEVATIFFDISKQNASQTRKKM